MKAKPVENRGTVQPRRFEMGASSLGNDEFLRHRGWEVKKGRGGASSYSVRKIDGAGRPRTMTKTQLMDFLDAERIACGLQPLKRRSAA